MSHTCVVCETKESSYWRGMRKGTPTCDRCYAKKYNLERRKPGKASDIWGGAIALNDYSGLSRCAIGKGNQKLAATRERDGVTERRCYRCKEWKLPDSFYVRNATMMSGKICPQPVGYCKPCGLKIKRQTYARKKILAMREA